jgi:hypothetical protein
MASQQVVSDFYGDRCNEWHLSLSFSLSPCYCCDGPRFVSISQAEGNMKSFRQGLEGETMIPEYAPLVGVASLPNFVRSVAKKFLPPRVSHLLSCGSKL